MLALARALFELALAPPRAAGGLQIRATALRLGRLLETHGGMEERIVYGIIDLVVGPAEREALVRRCQLAAAAPPARP